MLYFDLLIVFSVEIVNLKKLQKSINENEKKMICMSWIWNMDRDENL